MRLAILALLATALAGPKVKAPAPAPVVGFAPQGVGLPAGAPAPTGLITQNLRGETVPLDKVFAAGPTLLVFYRGGWCPYCNGQLRELSLAARRFQARGVRLVAVSVDRPEAAATTQAAWEIPFPVLSDSDLTAHEAFRVVFEVDAATRETYRGWGIDLKAASGRSDGRIATPAMFLVQGGAVTWAHADPAYKVRPTPDQVLDALSAAGLP
jgi:peroxiredoxin